VRAPITFIYGNCVLAAGLDDSWAAFVLAAPAYAWLDDDAKRARFLALIGALEALEADVQILRVSRSWEVERYERELAGEGTARGRTSAHAAARRRYLEEQVKRLGDLEAQRPVVFMLVSLSDPERDVASYVSTAAEGNPRQWWDGLRRAFSIHERRVLSVSELERMRVRADRAHARLADFLPVRQARGVELQWLVRRAFCRGLGEPEVEGLHEPRALLFERNGEAVLAPLEGDVMRWSAARPDSVSGRSCRADVCASGKPAIRD
jgi:hypothetical protein